MAIDPVRSVQTAQSSATATGQLGKDDFLNLLVSQLRHQDPMKPMEDKDFMGQMAQFSSLEQITNLAGAMERLTFASSMAGSVSLLGRTVTYQRADGTTASGEVASVAVSDGKITMRVGEDEITPNAITGVA